MSRQRAPLRATRLHCGPFAAGDTALLGEKELVSIDLPPDTFESLRGQPGLRMACCETSAVPKRSVLSLPFFAHAKAGTCSSPPETAFYLQGKAIMLRAARAAGWDASVEMSGQTPSGERWRADVLCLQSKKRVAFKWHYLGGFAPPPDAIQWPQSSLIGVVP